MEGINNEPEYEQENDIINLNNQVLELKEQINFKISELNELKLHEEKNYIIKFYIDDMNKKKILKAVKMFENFFNIKFDIKKSLLFIKEAKYINIETNDCFWEFKINKYGVQIGFIGALASKEVKIILTKVMTIIKEINKDNIVLGTAGIEGLSIPEIENGEFEIIKLG